MEAPTDSPKIHQDAGKSTGATKGGNEGLQVDFRTSAWQDLKEAMNRRRSRYRGKKHFFKGPDSESTLDLDASVESHRSLVSESKENDGDKTWGRTFDSLRPLRHPRSVFDLSEDLEFPSMSPRGVDAFTEPMNKATHLPEVDTWSALCSSTLARSPNYLSKRIEEALESPIIVERLSAPALEGQLWHGTVTIAQDEEPYEEPTEEAIEASSTAIRHLTKYPQRLKLLATPPRKKKFKRSKLPKKIASKREKTRRAQPRACLDVVSVAWGDYAMTQQASFLDVEDLSTSRFTQGKLEFRFDVSFHDSGHASDKDDGWADLIDRSLQERVTFKDNMDFRQHIIDRISFSALPRLPYLPSDEPDSFLAKFHAAYGTSNEESEDEDDSEKDETIEFCEVEAEGETRTGARNRVVCFADEQGLPIARVHQVGDKGDSGVMGRIIVLCLDPSAKKFEFMQGEYCYRSEATVSDLLTQLPSFATEERFKLMRFSALWSTSESRKFSLNEKLHQLELGKLEVTLAVMEGSCGARLLVEASPVLSNNHVMRAVKKASHVGRGLKYILSNDEMEQDRRGMLENSSTANSETDEPSLETTKSNCDTRNLSTQTFKPKPYDIPLISMCDPCDDEIPDLSHDYFRPAPWEGIRAEDAIEPRKLMNYLHATLWATIGVAFAAKRQRLHETTAEQDQRLVYVERVVTCKLASFPPPVPTVTEKS